MSEQNSFSASTPQESSHQSRFPMLLNASQAAEFVGMNETSWWRLLKAEKIPKPVRLTGKMIRWPLYTLKRWCETGCLPQSEFQAYQDLRDRGR